MGPCPWRLTVSVGYESGRCAGRRVLASKHAREELGLPGGDLQRINAGNACCTARDSKGVAAGGLGERIQSGSPNNNREFRLSSLGMLRAVRAPYRYPYNSSPTTTADSTTSWDRRTMSATVGWPRANCEWVFRNPGGKSGSPGDTGGVEIKAAEVKVDGVAESLAVAEPAR